jgi:hypothetical protein
MVTILLRGNYGDVIFKCINIVKVEENIEDDLNLRHGYYVTINILNSFAVTIDYETGKEKSKINSFSDKQNGFYQISSSDYVYILSIITENIQIRITPPSVSDCTSFFQEISNDINNINFAAQLLKYLIKNYSLDNIWGSSKYKNPYLNFAIEYLKKSDGIDKNDIISNMSLLLVDQYKDKNDKLEKMKLPIIDIEFEPIVVENISSRKFHAIDYNYDVDSIMVKTEDAEKRHQEILKDICKYLINCKIQPMQSSSIDFAVRKNFEYYIFEIKTTNKSNIISQVAKGIFQLALYSEALTSVEKKCSSRTLILETAHDALIETFIKNAAKSLNIDVMHYFSNNNWPNKLSPIIKITED